MDWSLFGWEGISFLLPSDWDLGLIQGGAREGYLRIDDPHMTRVEVKWEKSKGGFSPSKTIDRYIRTLGKKAKDLQVFRRVTLKGAGGTLSKGEGEFFILQQGELRAHCLVRSCRECNRVLLMQIWSKSRENMDGIVQRIYRSLKDHPIKGYNPWGIYGLQFKLPEDYVLERRSLVSGRIQLTFKRKGSRLRVERLSLADVLLEEKPLDKWFSESYQKDLNSFGYVIEQTKGLKHDALRIRGSRKKRLLEGYLWHCPFSNKIFVILNTGEERDRGVLEKLFWGIKCHREGKQS